jgi:NTP pyrophosphatase (non-canonical NTP hydrolase)
MLKQLQAEQLNWVKHNFGDRPSWQPLLGAVEELGELCHAHLKASQGIRISEPHQEAKIDAIGDIIIYLADYCSAENIDIEMAVLDTWQKVKQRDWKKYPVNGLNL